MKINKAFNTDKIEQAIVDFEKQVDFELVPVVTNSSSPVGHIKWVITFIFSLISFVVIEAIYFFEFYELGTSEVIYWWGSSLIFGFIISIYIAKLSVIQRLFISKKNRQESVDLKAQQVFFQKRMYDTETHQGLLLFVSLMERRIVIMPDPKSQYQGTQALTNEVLRILQHAFKAKQYEAGFLQAIDFMKKDLIQHFPMENHKNQVNELPNKLIWLDE